MSDTKETTVIITQEEAINEINKNYAKAEKLLQNEEKLEKLLRKLEHKLENLPLGVNSLKYIPIMGSLINSYIKKKYRELPVATIAYCIAVVIYFVSPIDLFPDILPGGYIDDAAIVAASFPFIKKDLDDYIKWRNENDTLDK